MFQRAVKKLQARVTVNNEDVPHTIRPLTFRHRRKWKGRTFVSKGVVCWTVTIDSQPVVIGQRIHISYQTEMGDEQADSFVHQLPPL